jgi:anti-sigma regulatory factor (Ser/Thr protein kinase)
VTGPVLVPPPQDRADLEDLRWTTTGERHRVDAEHRVSGWPAGKATSTGTCRHTHDALLYDSPGQLVEIAVPFLLQGLDAGDAAVIATGAGTADLLREAIGGHPGLHVLERGDVYRTRTPAAITTFRRLAELRASEGARRVRVVGEVDFGPTERNWLEWQRYEAVVNDALAGWPLWGLCVFDTQRLPEPLLATALHTHPHLATARGREDNPHFTEPAEYLRALPVPDEPLDATVPRLHASHVADFASLRRALATELAGVPADSDVVQDFLLAVDEMTSNALRHGGRPIDLRLWIGTERIVCTIGDRGTGWDDPFAGYGPAHGDDLSHGGMGLWLARQLCDHVDITTGPDGAQVRLTLTF